MLAHCRQQSIVTGNRGAELAERILIVLEDDVLSYKKKGGEEVTTDDDREIPNPDKIAESTWAGWQLSPTFCDWTQVKYGEVECHSQEQCRRFIHPCPVISAALQKDSYALL